jgi:hypothetical protein
MSSPSPSPGQDDGLTEAEVQERLRVNNVLEAMMGNQEVTDDDDDDDSENGDVQLEWLMNAESTTEDAAMGDIWVDEEGEDDDFYDDAEYLEHEE